MSRHSIVGTKMNPNEALNAAMDLLTQFSKAHNEGDLEAAHAYEDDLMIFVVQYVATDSHPDRDVRLHTFRRLANIANAALMVDYPRWTA